MPYVYRRPFDYSQRRQTFNLWQLAASIEATSASASFTTFAATITSGGVASENPSRTVRFSARGIFRERWSYAANNARITLFYSDAQSIEATAAEATFTTFPAEVQIGANSGATINASVAEAAFATYQATVTGDRRDPLGDGVGTFTTYAADITRTAGLGVSRVGQVAAQASGTYAGGSMSVTRRSGRKNRAVHELAKRK